ncbi:MAG: ribosomal L7Ae/L30e/S12e/Gadd45 family protein [archaeon]
MEHKEFVKLISKAVSEKKIVLGTERALKFLKAGKLSLVAYSENTPENIKKEIAACLGQAAEYKFPGTNVDLGEISKRPHQVSVVGILKEA